MSKIAVFLIFLTFIAGCKTIPAPPAITPPIEQKLSMPPAEKPQTANSLQFKELRGYFIKNNVKLAQPINFFAINSLSKFNDILGVVRTTGNSANIPDFGNNMLLIIAMKPSQIVNDIFLNSVYISGSEICVEYEIKPAQKQDIGYFILNMKAFEIEKPSAIISNIRFINKQKSSEMLYFGERNNSSPLNVSDMLTNYTGTYKGTFPSANGKGVATILELKPNYTYVIRQEYLSGANEKNYKSSGSWQPSQDLHSFSISDEENNKWMIFNFIDKNTIEKLDANGEKINSDLYKMKK